MARRTTKVAEVARKRYWREADARLVIAAWRQSGDGVSSFARKHGLRPARLARWAARLEPTAEAAVPFFPVRLVGTAEPAARPAAAEPIEVVLVGGQLVRVPDGVAVGHLRRVLEVLGERPGC